MDTWNPNQYNRFTSERSRPFWDLVAPVAKVEGNVLDVGCGTGELTAEFHQKRVEAGVVGETWGIDSSAQMLAKAPSAAGLFFEQAKIETFTPDRDFDLVISNAAIQWVDNHKEVIPRMWGWARRAMAIQMPCNFDHSSHVLAEKLARAWGLRVRETPVMAPERYARLMYNLGASNISVFMKVYLHPMKGASDVVEWTKGTLLTHYQKQLSPERYADFLKEYSKMMEAKIGTNAYLYTFKRLFIIATRKKN
jgi:trans-aconitate 2-methyltransferase